MFIKRKPEPGDISFYRDHRGIHLCWEGRFDIVVEIFKAKPKKFADGDEPLDSIERELMGRGDDADASERHAKAMATLEESCPSCADLLRQIELDLEAMEGEFDDDDLMFDDIESRDDDRTPVR